MGQVDGDRSRGGLGALVCAVALVTTLSTPATASAVPLFGFGDSSAVYPYEGAPDAERLADLEADAGAEIARITVMWNVVQPDPPPLGGQPVYHWEMLDPLIQELSERGIQPLLMLLGTPSWARDPAPLCSGTLCPPSTLRLNDWASFAAAAASRYPTIAGIEVWNEPNHAANWQTAQGPQPSRYAEMFERAANAVHAVNPGINVIIGSVGYTFGGNQPNGDMTIPTFLNGFYDAVEPTVLRPSVGLGVHAYPGLHELDQLKPNGQFATIMSQIRSVRNARDPGRLLWVTELGASTTAVRDEGPVTEEEQASAILNVLANFDSAQDVRAAFVYTVVERPPGTPVAEEGYGVVKRGPAFTPKLAYCEVAAYRGAAPPAGCE